MELTNGDKKILSMGLMALRTLIKHPSARKDIAKAAEHAGITEEYNQYLDRQKKFNEGMKSLSGVISNAIDLLAENMPEDTPDETPPEVEKMIDAINKASKDQKPNLN
jgi:uncharacterized protein YhaN